MATDINKVFIVGRLTRDPEFKMAGQSSVVNFSIACGRTYMSGSEKKEETSFFECEAWGKLADIIKQYAKKGKQVAIDGRLKQQSWETPDGKKASKVRIVVESLQLLGPSGSGGSSQNEPVPQEEYQPGADIQSMPDDDVIF